MARKKSKRSKLDLNNDGKFDEKDKSIAATVLASKVEESPTEEVLVEEPKVEGKVAKVDISIKYRKGDLVPEEQIALWKRSGIRYEVWF